MHFGVHRHHTDWITTVKVETVESLQTYTCLHSNTEKSLNSSRIQCPDYTKRNTEPTLWQHEVARLTHVPP